MGKLRLLVVVALLTLLGTSSSGACECGWVIGGKLDVSAPAPPITAEEASRYIAIFTGTVKRLELELIPTNTCEGCATREVVAAFTVERVWGGEVSGEYRVRTPLEGTACGYKFQIGVTYVVYVEDSTREFPYGVTRCSRTKPARDAAVELQFLRGWTAVGRQPGSGS